VLLSEPKLQSPPPLLMPLLVMVKWWAVGFDIWQLIRIATVAARPSPFEWISSPLAPSASPSSGNWPLSLLLSRIFWLPFF
jgi:hypothetical protein